MTFSWVPQKEVDRKFHQTWVKGSKKECLGWKGLGLSHTQKGWAVQCPLPLKMKLDVARAPLAPTWRSRWRATPTSPHSFTMKSLTRSLQARGVCGISEACVCAIDSKENSFKVQRVQWNKPCRLRNSEAKPAKQIPDLSQGLSAADFLWEILLSSGKTKACLTGPEIPLAGFALRSRAKSLTVFRVSLVFSIFSNLSRFLSILKILLRNFIRKMIF